MVNFVSVKKHEEDIKASFLRYKIRKYLDEFEEYITKEDLDEIGSIIINSDVKNKQSLFEYTESLLKNIDIIDEHWEFVELGGM